MELVFPFFNSLAFCVVEAQSILELLEKRLWNFMVGHSVAGHHELVEVIFVCDDIGLHALVVDEVYLECECLFLFCFGSQILLLDYFETGVVLDDQ